MVAEGVRVMGAADYLIWSLLAASCAAGSAQLFMAAEQRHGALAQVWLVAMAFGLWSALALCFWGTA